MGNWRPDGLAAAPLRSPCSRGARDRRFPEGAVRPRPLGDSYLLSVAAAPLPGSPGTFCTDLPLPRSHPAPEPGVAARGGAPLLHRPTGADPRGGGSASNLNTSPAVPPHHAPPSAKLRGPSARQARSRVTRFIWNPRAGEHLPDAGTPAEKGRGGVEGPSEGGVATEALC